MRKKCEIIVSHGVFNVIILYHGDSREDTTGA